MTLEVRMGDGRGGFLDARLYIDSNGRPSFSSRKRDHIQPGFVPGEANFSNSDPRVQAIFVQPDLSYGVGVQVQHAVSEPEHRGYHYADRMDWSIPGQGQAGPQVATVSVPANSGPLSGMGVLAGTAYLALGRIVASYDAGAGTVAQVQDFGAARPCDSLDTYWQAGAEASDQTSTGTGATDVISGPSMLAAEKITPPATTHLGRVDLQLARTDVAAIQNVAIAGTPTGAHYHLCLGGLTTGEIAYNAAAADVQTALQALAGYGSVTVQQTGSSPNFTNRVEFAGVVGAVPVLGYVNDLTGGTPTITVTVVRAGETITGDIELAVQADYNGAPSGEDLAVATCTAKSVPASAGTVSFRFDDDDSYLQVAGEPYWIVLRAIGATSSSTLAWTGTTSGDQNGATSTDGGSSWAAAYKHYHTTYSKSITAALFLGQPQGQKLAVSTDGSTFTSDATFQAKYLLAWESLLVRDCRSASSSAISWSSDGKNWSEALELGDLPVPVTGLYGMQSFIVVATEESIWAVDPTQSPPSFEEVYRGPRSTTNGVGGCVWKGTCYLPFGGRLAALSGTMDDLALRPSVGWDGLPEWDSPWGAGRVVAVAGDRHYLYAAYSTTSGGYKLFKCADPLDKPGHGWHGSIADLGSPSAFTFLGVFDAGGTTSPVLFFPTTSDALGKIVLSRVPNPAGDTAYRYNVGMGKTYWPRCTGLFPTQPERWLDAPVFFQAETASDYVEELYELLDGAGNRALGRLYRTGSLPYRMGRKSLLLDRQTWLTTSVNTASPLLLASGVNYQVVSARELREFKFVIVNEDGMSSDELASLLGCSEEETAAAVWGATLDGTRTLVTHRGREYAVAFTDVTEYLTERRLEGSSATLLEVTALGRPL